MYIEVRGLCVTTQLVIWEKSFPRKGNSPSKDSKTSMNLMFKQEQKTRELEQSKQGWEGGV